MYDFLMIGWELDYSRNRVMVDKKRFKIKEIEVKKENLLIRDLKTFFKTLFALIKYKTNVVYIPSFNQVNAPFIILLSKLFRKKLIIDILVSEYDTVVEDRKFVPKGSLKAKRAYWLDEICLKYGDILICDTELHKEYFVEKFGCNPNKIVVIPVGAEEHFEFIEDKQQSFKQDLNIVFYGGFSPLHGIDVILKAAYYLQEEKDIKFTLVGSGQTKNQMLDLAKELNLQNTTFIDRVNYEELPLFLSKFDIGLGIFGETEKAQRVVPNKVYQIAACKKPVITRNTPGIQEVFTDNKDIVLVSSEGDQAEKLANAIRELKEDSTKRNEIALQGYKLMTKAYSFKNIRSSFNALIGR